MAGVERSEPPVFARQRSNVMDLNLNDHIAVITGGASGIGKACATGFLQEGASVVLWDISDAVETAATELSAGITGAALGIRVDITDGASVTAALARTLKHFGRIDHLVHAAAIG